ncbi:MAG: hypothetical protein V1859_02705 [archaeon]
MKKKRLLMIILMIASVFSGCSLNSRDSTEFDFLQRQIEVTQQEKSLLQNQKNQLLGQVEELEKELEQQNKQSNEQNNQLQAQVNELQKRIEQLNIQKDNVTVPVVLSVQKEPNKITFSAKIKGKVYMPDSKYLYPTGSWQIFKLENNGWNNIGNSGFCSSFCDSVCRTGTVACVAGGPSPICQLASLEEKFEWNKRYIDFKNTTCGGETYSCAYYKNAEPGQYKIVFNYKTDCSDNHLYEESQSQLYAEEAFTI